MKTLAKAAIYAATSLPGWEYLAWPFAKNFIAGRTVEDALKTKAFLEKNGYKTILNYASEHINPLDSFKILEIKRAYAEILRGLEDGGALSLKLSQFGLCGVSTLDLHTFGMSSFIWILTLAKKRQVRVWLDAEYLKDEPSYSKLLENLWSDGFTNIGRVIQAYNRPENWKKIIDKCCKVPAPVRVCKGAYRDDPLAVRLPKNNELVLEQYRYAVDTFLSRGIEVEIATGDPFIAHFWKGRIGHNLTAHFALLRGINIALAKELKNSGKDVFIYLIFGKEWGGYVKRRLLENPSYLLLPFSKQEVY